MVGHGNAVHTLIVGGGGAGPNHLGRGVSGKLAAQ